MARVVIELTNRCNLSCEHCFSGRHGGKDELPLDLFAKILAEAKACGFDHLSFTGGEPTIHRQFSEILRMTCRDGYRFSLVTNGWNLAKRHSDLLSHRDHLEVVTFSMEGATESTHDDVRGKGSFRRLLQAISVCVVRDVPFTINMVVSGHNRHELEEAADLATRLGSRGLRFGHLMPSPLTTARGFDLTPWEHKVVEAEIWAFRSKFPIPISMAPGYHTTDPFPCAPLQMQELNVDCRGNLTKCCHLSGHGDGVGRDDVIGSLAEMSFSIAYSRLVRENEAFHRAKSQRLSDGHFQDTDFFPCWYCSLKYEKVGWLRWVKDHPWGVLVDQE